MESKDKDEHSSTTSSSTNILEVLKEVEPEETSNRPS